MQRPGPHLRLRKDEFLALARSRGLKSQADIARALDLHPATVMRLVDGVRRPGEVIIATVLAAFPGTQFEDVFAVTTSDDEDDEEKLAA